MRPSGALGNMVAEVFCIPNMAEGKASTEFVYFILPCCAVNVCE